MTKAEMEESKDRRDRLYSILYNTVIKTIKEDRKILLTDALEASILLLLNSIKVCQKHDPHIHIRVLDYIIKILDSGEVQLSGDDEKKHH